MSSGKKATKEEEQQEEVRVGAAQVGAKTATKGVKRATNAKRVAETMEHIRKPRAAGTSRSVWVKEMAKQTAASTGPNGKTGARVQLKGHFIERLDNDTYNAKNLLTGKTQVPRKGHLNPAYDATRIVTKKVDGKAKKTFAGGLQQKSGASGIDSAVSRFERAKPGSAKRATVRVPQDQLEAATKRARGRTRVLAMDFTSKQAEGAMDKGLTDLAKKGTNATSKVRAVAKGSVISAGISTAVGGATEYRALKNGDLTGRDYFENRLLDATEGGVSAATGTMAAGGAGVLVTGALGTATGASAAASLGAAGTAALGTIGGMGTAGATVATALSGVTVAAAAPVVVGAGASLLVGIGVTKGAKAIRRKVKAREEARRAVWAEIELAAIEAAELEDGGIVIELHPIGRSETAEPDDGQHLREAS